MTHLFSESRIRGKSVRNRIVMPPMVCFNFPSRNGQPTEMHIKHYNERARGGTGLIIIEATCVNIQGRLWDGQLGLWSDHQISGFRQIAEKCHQNGAVVLVQIHHAGLAVAQGITQNVIAPSDFQGKTRFSNPEFTINAREMSQDEIRMVQNEFVAAAIRAKKAGLDGVELHGAHGYLISQFLSPRINRREDSYGGNLLKRTRFVKEIITGIRRTCGLDFIIGCRLGADEPDLASGMNIAREIEKAGADIVHISSGMASVLKHYDSPPISIPPGFNYNWITYSGTQVKRQLKIPVIACNSIHTPDRAAYLIENNLADFIAIGKSLLIDAEWANKAAQHIEPVRCLECQVCAYFRPGSVCPQVAKTKVV